MDDIDALNLKGFVWEKGKIEVIAEIATLFAISNGTPIGHKSLKKFRIYLRSEKSIEKPQRH